MRLFIAEKPSLARAIADALPGPQTKKTNHIECGQGNVVAWCVGHILEQAPPEVYNPAWKAWRAEDLPMVPKVWKHIPKSKALLDTIQRLLKKADRVVHAGDPDREGQLLVDEVLDYFDYRGPVDRVLIADLNRDAVVQALSRLRPNAETRPLGMSALARQRSDWILGLNMTRLFTIKAGNQSGQIVSVGRVQTPLLGLIVRRDLEIENFRPKPFFTIAVRIGHPTKPFAATWKPEAQHEQYQDADGRLVNQPFAEALTKRLQNKTAKVVKCERLPAEEAPPLPYCLSDLQIEAGRVHGLSAKQVLDACQGLYETHCAATYPRSDCRYLPVGHHAEASSVLKAVGQSNPGLSQIGTDVSRKSAAWNDKKVTAHHALIPTPRAVDTSRFTKEERAIYEMPARRYVAQFLPPHRYEKTEIVLNAESEVFVARGKRTTDLGWRKLEGEHQDAEAVGGTDEADEAESNERLPMVEVDGVHPIAGVDLRSLKTTPPKRFTDATIIQAMSGIARFVSDPEIKRLLREADGIGTPATQAQIIETLYQRRFVEKQGKNVVSTALARALISALPNVLTQPDMTALWEAAMRSIESSKLTVEEFLGRVVSQVGQLIDEAKRTTNFAVPSMPTARPKRTGRRSNRPKAS